MTVRQSAYAVGMFGAFTTLLLLVGLESVGGVFALLQLGLFVGAPLAVVLYHDLRSWRVVIVVAAALSVALTAIAVQLLIWFRVATSELLVVTATTYGVILAWLLSSADYGRVEPASRSERSSTPTRASTPAQASTPAPAPRPVGDGDGVPNALDRNESSQ